LLHTWISFEGRCGLPADKICEDKADTYLNVVLDSGINSIVTLFAMAPAKRAS
jgi:hypothetical protein